MSIRKQWKDSLAIITDPCQIEELIDLSEKETGFNLKRCYKECDVDTEYLRCELLGELAKGVERPKSCSTIVGHPEGVCIVKVRIGTKTSGKRSGWRVYVLLFECYGTEYGIVLGVTMHSNGVDNFTPQQLDRFKKLVDAVESEINK